MKTNPDECAFPADSRESGTFKGLSKREYFAAMAMQGILSSGSNYTFKVYAETAVKCADALIAELNKEPK